jgi:hypothetical protein
MSATETQRNYQQVRQNAVIWARQLKFKDAAADLLSLPFVLIGGLFGLLWFLVRVMVGLVVEGFHYGGRTQRKEE